MKPSKRLKFLGMILALLVLAGLLAACGLGRPALLGKWSDPQTGAAFEFTDAGKMIITSADSPMQEVDYQFQNDTTIMLPDGTVLTFKVEGNTLSLNVGGQQEIILTR